MIAQKVLCSWLAVFVVIAAHSTTFGQECQTTTGSKTVTVNPFSGEQHLTSPMANRPVPTAPATPAAPPMAPTASPPKPPEGSLAEPQTLPPARQAVFSAP